MTSEEYDEKYRKALMDCADWYMYLAFSNGMEELHTFCQELHFGAYAGVPIPKLCRWLGYIQGVLIAAGITTVEKERDRTRPMFRPLDYPEGE